VSILPEYKNHIYIKYDFLRHYPRYCYVYFYHINRRTSKIYIIVKIIRHTAGACLGPAMLIAIGRTISCTQGSESTRKIIPPRMLLAHFDCAPSLLLAKWLCADLLCETSIYIITIYKKDMDYSMHTFEDSMYTSQQKQQLIWLYSGASLVWLIFYYFIGGFSRPQLFYKLIVFLPIILFGVTIYSLNTITDQSEQTLYKTNFLSIGLVIFFPIFSSIVSKYKGDTKFFITLMISGFIFSLLSLYDVWTAPEYQPLLKHSKTILQTFTITVIIIAMYTFHLNETDTDTMRKARVTVLL